MDVLEPTCYQLLHTFSYLVARVSPDSLCSGLLDPATSAMMSGESIEFSPDVLDCTDSVASMRLGEFSGDTESIDLSIEDPSSAGGESRLRLVYCRRHAFSVTPSSTNINTKATVGTMITISFQ